MNLLNAWYSLLQIITTLAVLHDIQITTTHFESSQSVVSLCTLCSLAASHNGDSLYCFCAQQFLAFTSTVNLRFGTIYVFWNGPSLWWGEGCDCYCRLHPTLPSSSPVGQSGKLVLALDSTVSHGSGSHGTCDHIFQSHSFGNCATTPRTVLSVSQLGKLLLAFASQIFLFLCPLAPMAIYNFGTGHVETVSSSSSIAVSIFIALEMCLSSDC